MNMRQQELCFQLAEKYQLHQTGGRDFYGENVNPDIDLLIPLYSVGGLLALLVLLGTPWGGRAAKEGLQKAGLTNHAGEAPVLIAKRPDADNPRLTVWEFDPCGIPLNEWEDKRAGVETALNITIAKMTWGEGRKIIRIYAVPAESDFPALLRWNDKYLSLDSFVLVLGESLMGPVTVNLAHVPHILLGGSTGSGKSVLLKLLLMQSLHKGAEVYIADFKGGVDFPKVWHQKCQMCFNEDDLLYTLNQLAAVLEYRKGRLAETGCPNLDAYNEQDCSEILLVFRVENDGDFWSTNDINITISVLHKDGTVLEPV